MLSDRNGEIGLNKAGSRKNAGVRFVRSRSPAVSLGIG